MQVTINIPENLPEAVIQQQITEFEEKLKEQAKQITPMANNKKQKTKIPNHYEYCKKMFKFTYIGSPNS